jgi:hypothetical protein
MLVVDDEHYCNATEAAIYLGIHRCMFHNNVQQNLKAYKLGVRKRNYYKLSDLEPLRSVRQVEPVAVAS